jgi:hypothetical protein
MIEEPPWNPAPAIAKRPRKAGLFCWEGVKVLGLTTLAPVEDLSGSQIERFVHTLMITGGWLMELMSGLSAELPKDAYPGEETWAVVFEMLCGTIGTALDSVEPGDVQQATELMDLAGSRVEEHLRLACELSRRARGPGAADHQTYG